MDEYGLKSNNKEIRRAAKPGLSALCSREQWMMYEPPDRPGRQEMQFFHPVCKMTHSN